VTEQNDTPTTRSVLKREWVDKHDAEFDARMRFYDGLMIGLISGGVLSCRVVAVLS
jgi:hypothetical protein